MKTITIRSKKYDGRLRDEYQAFLYAEDADTVLVYVPPGTMGYDHRKQAWSPAPDGLLERYFTSRWYTVWYIGEQRSAVNHMYIHLSMPASVTTTGIEWVDLDIDYRVHLDGRIERLDEDEYRAHQVSIVYPATILEQVRSACTVIESDYPTRQYPFNHGEHVALYEQIKRSQ